MSRSRLLSLPDAHGGSSPSLASGGPPVAPVGFGGSFFDFPEVRSGADPVCVHPADTARFGVAGDRGPQRLAAACSAGSGPGPVDRTPEPSAPVLNFLGTTRVYLAVGATDLRKSFDTLAGDRTLQGQVNRR